MHSETKLSKSLSPTDEAPVPTLAEAVAGDWRAASHGERGGRRGVCGCVCHGYGLMPEFLMVSGSFSLKLGLPLGPPAAHAQ